MIMARAGPRRKVQLDAFPRPLRYNVRGVYTASRTGPEVPSPMCPSPARTVVCLLALSAPALAAPVPKPDEAPPVLDGRKIVHFGPDGPRLLIVNCINDDLNRVCYVLDPVARKVTGGP